VSNLAKYMVKLIIGMKRADPVAITTGFDHALLAHETWCRRDPTAALEIIKIPHNLGVHAVDLTEVVSMNISGEGLDLSVMTCERGTKLVI
jgi:hypothetical protein